MEHKIVYVDKNQKNKLSNDVYYTLNGKYTRVSKLFRTVNGKHTLFMCAHMDGENTKGYVAA
jgi:hypothetical protein